MNVNTPARHILISAMAACVAIAASRTSAVASGNDRAAPSHATLTNESYRPFLINNLFNYYGNNGDGSHNKFSLSNEGFEFPKGSDKHIIFEDGLLWGGFHKGRDTAKAGGSVYWHALQPGPLLTNGTPTTGPVAADPSDPRYHIYSVRPDVGPDTPFPAVAAMLNAEDVLYISRYEPLSARDIYDRYITDWNAWPAADGAPFTDVNKDGMYDPAVDIPGQPGAGQTLWYVANDMNDSLTQRLAGCPPIGIEVQRTIWGYGRNGVLGNTIFISTVLINKSGAPVDSMYITQWSDPDLGYAGDDHVGCDTTFDFGYVYNGGAFDATYGVAVPAAGFTFIQGPMTPGAPTDTALFLSSRRPGFRNLRMSSFVVFVDGYHQFNDPARGTNGDLQWYRLMQGTDVHAGRQFLDINTSDTTRFCFSGDPVKSTTVARVEWTGRLLLSRATAACA
ncbi:MAG: hypothetical protein IPI01_16740 [Ignavibacteriae bacterium]|nr:hypothetical protein [Ignavibacteriota bacterium]